MAATPNTASQPTRSSVGMWLQGWYTTQATTATMQMAVPVTATEPWRARGLAGKSV